MGKNERRLRYDRISKAVEPFRVAKKRTIHELAKIGRTHKVLRYPILAVLVVFVFVYNLLLHFFIRWKMEEKLARALAATMTVVLTLTSVDLTAFALSPDAGTYYRISKIDQPETKIEVPFGTDVEAISLPETLNMVLDECQMVSYVESIVVDENKDIEEVPETPDLSIDPNASTDENTDGQASEESEGLSEEQQETDQNIESPETKSEDEDSDTSKSTEIDSTEPDASEPDSDESDSAVEETTTVTVETEPVYAEADEKPVVTITAGESEKEEETKKEEPASEEPEPENKDEELKIAEPTDDTLVEKIVGQTVVDFPVEYTCETYDPYTAGEYVFSAVLPETYDDKPLLSGDLSLPEITVKVLEPKELHLSMEVDGIRILLDAAAGVFPEDALLSVEKVTDAAANQKIQEAVQNEVESRSTEEEQFTAGDVIVFDIKVLNAEGEELQPRVPEGMTQEDAVKVTFENVAPELTEEYGEEGPATDYTLDVFHIDDAMEEVTFLETEVEGDNLSISPEHFSYYGCTCSLSSMKSVYTWKELYKAVYRNDVKNVRLKSNIQIKKISWSFFSNYLYICNGETVNLDLNGYTLSSAENTDAAIVVDYGELIIHDKSSSGSGKISAPNCDHVILADSGDVELTGGIIYQTNDTMDGVYLDSKYSHFVMTGGGICGAFDDAIEISSSGCDYVSISGGYIDGANWGIYSSGSGLRNVTVSGGTFQNYKKYGIYNSCLDLKVTGGTFTGYASARTYGIYNTNNGKLSLQGNVTFSNNRSSDIYVGSNSANLINLIGDLGTDTISIATATTPTTAEKGGTQFTTANSNAAANKGKFYSGVNTSYEIYQLTNESFLRVGPKPDCKITVQPAIEGIHKINATVDGSGKVTAQEVGKVSIDAAEPTYDVSGQTLTVKYNTPMVLKATLVDTEHYVFAGWRSTNSNNIVRESLNYSITVRGGDTYQAVFQRKTYPIKVTSSSAIMGGAVIKEYYVNDEKQSSIPSDSIFEQGSKITLCATENRVRPDDDSRYYKFAQWNDGNTDDNKGEADPHTYERTVTVTGKMDYVAQFRNPDPDPNATGELFVGVKPLVEGTTYPEGTKILLVEGEMKTTTDGNGQQYLAISGLPANSARLIITRSEWKDYYNQAVQYQKTVNETTVSIIKDPEKHDLPAGATSGTSTTLKGESGKFYYVNIQTPVEDNKGAEFDTCPGGIISKASCGSWHYWCNGSGVQGAGPYNAYTYTDSGTFRAYDDTGNSNITVTVNDIKLSDKDKITSSDITIKIKTQTNDGEKEYTLANLNFANDGAIINYVNGDRLIELDLGGVGYTHELPEAILSRGTDNAETRTEYNTIADALKNAIAGDTVYVYGPAVSEIVGTGVQVKQGVKIISYDGTVIDLNRDAKVNADSDGTVNLVNGTMTVTPPDANDITVGVGSGTVTTNKTITVSTDGGGTVTTTTPTQQVVISPDGDPEHTVTYKGCKENKTYGIHSGEFTTEQEVEIGKGTKYDLTIPGSNSSDDGIKVTTDSSNSGSTVVKQETGDDGKKVTITAEKSNDKVTINDETFTTTKTGTEITVKEGVDNPVLEKGGVDLSKGSSIVLPNGNTVTNTKTSASGSSPSVGVDADGKVTIPDGGEATVKPAGSEEGKEIKVSVPSSTPPATPNLPSTVTIGTDGKPKVETPAGSSVTIGDPSIPKNTYQVGDKTTFELDEAGKPTVTDGNVILAPGQSVTDSKGTTYTNNGNEPIDVTMSKDGDTQVEVPKDGSFEFTPAGTSTPIRYTNPGGGEATFNIDEDGDISLDSNLTMSNNKNVDVTMNGKQTNIKTPSGNTGNVKVDPVEGTVTIENENDKVSIDGMEYTAKTENTVLRPMGSNGVKLEEGSVALDRNEKVNVGGTTIQNAGNGACTVTADTTSGGNPTSDGATVSVPAGGSFAMSEPGSDDKVTFTNTSGSSSDYKVNQEGGLNIPAGETISFQQGSKKTDITAGDGGAVITPSEEGVMVKIPAGKTVTINGKEYTNKATSSGEGGAGGDLVLVIDKTTGNPVLANGSINLKENATVQLSDGSVITNNGVSGVGSESGDVSMDATGHMNVPAGGKITVQAPGKQPASYTAKDREMELSYDVETGVPTLESGCAEIGKNTSLDVLFNTIPESEGESEREQRATITSAGDAPAIVDKTNNKITVPKKGAIRVDSEAKDSNGTITETTNTIVVPQDAKNDVVDATLKADGSVDVTLPGTGDTVKVNGVEYTSTQVNTTINVAEHGSTLAAGAVNLDGGKTPKESIIANGTVITNLGGSGSDVAVEVLTNEKTSFQVSGGGQFSMAVPGKPNSTVNFKNPSTESSTYEIDGTGKIALGDGSSISFTTSAGENTVTGGDGVSIQMTEDGVAVKVAADKPVTIGGVTYTATGNGVTIVIDKNGRPIITEGEASVPYNQSVYIKDKDGGLTEIKKTAYEDADTVLKVSASGEISGSRGDTVKIGSSTYTCRDENGIFELTIDDETGDVTVNTGAKMEVTNGNLIKDGVKVSTTGSLPVVVEKANGSTKITVQPGGNATIGTSDSDNSVQVKLPAGTVSGKEVTRTSDGKISIDLVQGESVTIGGVIYTAQQSGTLTVDGSTGALDSSTITPEGQKPIIAIDPTSFNQSNYTYTVPAGGSVQVGDTLYTAPEGESMTLQGNPDGNPIVSVVGAGKTVSIGNKTYTTAVSNTKFVVNSPNNVTLIDNQNGDENSALKVQGSQTMVIDGNTITNTGGAGNGYVIQKTSGGDRIELKDDTKVTVSIGKTGSSVILNEDITYGGTAVPKPVKITASTAGCGVTVDKTKTDSDGNYVTSISPIGFTIMTPVKDGSGNVIGFTTKINPPTPPASNSGSGSSSSSSSKKEEVVEEVTPPVVPETPITPTTETPSKVTQETPSQEETANTAVDSPASQDNNTGTGTGENSGEKPGDESQKSEPEILAQTIVKVQAETIEEIQNIIMEGKADVTLGQGKVTIESGGEGEHSAITGELGTIMKACLTDDEIQAVQNGSHIKLRLNVVNISREETKQDEERAGELQQIKDRFGEYAMEIAGLQMADEYDIVIEKSIDGSKWQKVSELNDEIEVTTLIPTEIRKEKRTFFMIHNHQGNITILEDLDQKPYTITVRTRNFSAYVMCYSDEDVSMVSVEKVNQAVSGNSFPWGVLWIVIFAVIGLVILFLLKKQKEKNEMM